MRDAAAGGRASRCYFEAGMGAVPSKLLVPFYAGLGRSADGARHVQVRVQTHTQARADRGDWRFIVAAAVPSRDEPVRVAD